jgi:hypothetical protein
LRGFHEVSIHPEQAAARPSDARHRKPCYRDDVPMT